jgi:hypothetical protein
MYIRAGIPHGSGTRDFFGRNIAGSRMNLTA